MQFFVFLFLFYSLLSKTCLSNEKNKYLADDHAPISVMGDHIHKKKDIMFRHR